MKNFYFTFGSDHAYPYGREDFVMVEAENLNQAIQLFNAVHPKREGSDCVNCAAWYGEEFFSNIHDRYYRGVAPKEIISLKILRNP